MIFINSLIFFTLFFFVGGMTVAIVKKNKNRK